MKERVLNYLKSVNTGKTPTEIGLALGKNYNSASSSVSPALKSLKKENIIEKIKTDGRVLYKFIRVNPTKK